MSKTRIRASGYSATDLTPDQSKGGVLVSGRLMPCLNISLPVDGSSPTMRILSAKSGTLSFGDWLGVRAGLDSISLNATAPCREP